LGDRANCMHSFCQQHVMRLIVSVEYFIPEDVAEAVSPLSFLAVVAVVDSTKAIERDIHQFLAEDGNEGNHYSSLVPFLSVIPHTETNSMNLVNGNVGRTWQLVMARDIGQYQ
jgi:hypothetical protein